MEAVGTNNRTRRVEATNPNPPQEEDGGGDSGRERSYLQIAHSNFSGPRERSTSALIEIMANELKFPLRTFLAYAVVYNPNFHTQGDAESFDEIFGDRLFDRVLEVKLRSASEARTDEERSVWYRIAGNFSRRHGGFRSEQESLRAIRDGICRPFHLFYNEYEYRHDEDFEYEFTRDNYKKEALARRLDLDMPISELRTLNWIKSARVISSILVSQEDIKLESGAETI